MHAEDVEAAEQISDLAFFELDRATLPPYLPAPRRRSPEHAARWIERTRRTVRTDPGGCHVAEVGGRVVGFATALRREDVWCLATFALLPEHQGRGIGRPLLDAALAHGEGCRRGMLSASVDPKALRRYHAAGFVLHPQLQLYGVPDRAALPDRAGVRTGTTRDHPWMDELDRALRGGPHGPDHAWLTEVATLLVVGTDRDHEDYEDHEGYAYSSPDRLWLLAARSEEAARRLLAAHLARTEGRVEIHHVSHANQWAVRLGLDVGLTPDFTGYLALRGMEPPTPYLHDGALL